MRRILIALTICFVIVGVIGCRQPKPAFAEVNLPELLEKLPPLNQSVIFSLDENQFDYATSITLVSLFDKKINIDLGYSPRVEVLGLASFKLMEAKKYITFPILDKIVIEPFVYVGSRRIENLKELGEYDYGIGVKLVSLKW